MDDLKKKFRFLLIFIDILKILEIIITVSFGFYQLYLKFDILLMVYKILYIVLVLLVIFLIFLINDSLGVLLKGFYMIVENSFQAVEERKTRLLEKKTLKEAPLKKKTTKKKTVKKEVDKEDIKK